MPLRILQTIGSLDPWMGEPSRSVPQLAAAQAALEHVVMLWTPAPESGAIAGAGAGRPAPGAAQRPFRPRCPQPGDLDALL